MKTTTVKTGTLAKIAGSAALEYVLVSTFGLLAAVASIAFVGKMFKDKMDKMGEKLGLEASDIDLDVFPE